MMTARDQASRREPLRAVPIAAILTVILAITFAVTSGVARAATQVDLRTADSFAVLAGSAITNTGPTTITGDVGLHPGTAISGFDQVTHSGQQHIADTTAAQAQDDLVLAYDDAVGQGPSATVATQLGGQLLPGGVYNSADGTFQITGTLTLDAAGDPDAVWIFQTSSTLITASNSTVTLLNEADACNVFWQVGSSATLGTGTVFAGNILALTSATLNTSASVSGRVLARNGAVTMDTNTITRADCATPPAQPSPSPSEPAPPSPSPSESATASPSPTSSEPEPVVSPTQVAPSTPPTAEPQIAVVPSGPVETGDGSTAGEQTRHPATGLLLLPAIAGLALFVTWRLRAR